MAIDTKSGLRIRPLYEQLIKESLSDDNRHIKFPNRNATFLENGFLLSQLHGEGMRAMERQQQQMASEQFKQSLIKQIAINTGMNASSLRTEVDLQNRQDRVDRLLGGESPTAVYYDMSAADDEEGERQDTIDKIEREKDKKDAFTGLFQEEHTSGLRPESVPTGLREQASRIINIADVKFTPSSSSSGAGLGRGGETTSNTVGRPRTKSRPAPGTDDTTNPRGRPKGKAKPKD
jgi:hypothetical protein